MRAATWRTASSVNRQRQQVVEMPVVAAVAQVFAVQRHIKTLEKLPHFPQEPQVQRCRATEGQRQPVATQRVALGQGAQRGARGTADADPVFRRQFQKVKSARRRRMQ
jgi:hypothetical protein